MRTTAKIDGLTVEQARTVLAACARLRDEFPTYSRRDTEPHWAPVVHCEGSFFTVHVGACPVETLTRILAALEFNEYDDGEVTL